MTTIAQPGSLAGTAVGFLDRERIIAVAGFNRWLVPPAAYRPSSGSFGIGKGGLDAPARLFWAFVGISLAWGVWITLKSAVRILTVSGFQPAKADVAALAATFLGGSGRGFALR